MFLNNSIYCVTNYCAFVLESIAIEYIYTLVYRKKRNKIKKLKFYMKRKTCDLFK